jgi:lipopolysaccharide transport system permease protein
MMQTLVDDLRHRSLILLFTRRRIAARYRGTLLGRLWMVLLPLAMALLFTLVFTHFLPVRWPSAQTTAAHPLHTAINIYLALTLFNYLTENLTSAPHLILEHPQYVKKVVFPLAIFAYVNAAAAAIPLAAGLAVTLLLALFDPQAHLAYLWALPYYLLPMPLWALAIHWLLGALTVYLRDIGQLIAPLTTALMFLSPIFYSAATLDAHWQKLLALNPLTVAIESARQLLYPLDPAHPFPSPIPTLLSLGGAIAAALLGRLLFNRLQPGFADAL